ncbi:MAG: hypothetical protein B7Z02_12215 [Rhodobacterales bacterium 32-67-9]|nr:MAG: hypothetical protein B7Z02_12215 [Rhodobacterales bacterium 32-67-9]
MKSRLIATVTAAALALTTAMASPVAAGDRDKKVLTLLLGAAAVGLLINEANKNKKRGAPPVTRTDDTYGYGNGYGYAYRDDDEHGKKWRERDRRRQAIIPSQCVYTLYATRGPRDVVSGRCLQDIGVARRLPQHCAFDVNTDWGRRTVYGMRCLQENGFRIARAH